MQHALVTKFCILQNKDAVQRSVNLQNSNDSERAMDEFNVLALLDRCGSLEALRTIFVCQPSLIDISIDLPRTQHFAKELIKVCQMPINEMLEL